MDIIYLLFAILALAGLQTFIFGRFALRRLRYDRAFSVRAAHAGDTVEMVEEIRNAKFLPVPWLRAESRMSPYLRFGGGQEDEGALHETSEDALHHRSVFYLAPYSKVTRRHAVRVEKRGRYSVGSVALTGGDLFGLMESYASLDTGAAISVYPRLLRPEEIDWPSSRWQGELLVKRWIVPDPFLLAGIRDWQQGDAQRDVHWAATARTGRLQVKTRDYTASPKLLVVLNVQMQEKQWGDLMEYEQARIEYGISLAATLCVQALRAGLEAGFAANAPVGETHLSTVLLPARYAGRESDIMEAMACLRILRTKNFHALMDDLGQVSGYDILILSAYDSELIAERMAQLRMRGNSVALLPLQGGDAA